MESEYVCDFSPIHQVQSAKARLSGPKWSEVQDMSWQLHTIDYVQHTKRQLFPVEGDPTGTSIICMGSFRAPYRTNVLCQIVARS